MKKSKEVLSTILMTITMEMTTITITITITTMTKLRYHQYFHRQIIHNNDTGKGWDKDKTSNQDVNKMYPMRKVTVKRRRKELLQMLCNY